MYVGICPAFFHPQQGEDSHIPACVFAKIKFKDYQIQPMF
jgi:hypothetical protein